VPDDVLTAQGPPTVSIWRRPANSVALPLKTTLRSVHAIAQACNRRIAIPIEPTGKSAIDDTPRWRRRRQLRLLRRERTSDVESPAKAKTTQVPRPGVHGRGLVGHVRDLPQRRAGSREVQRRRKWSSLGVNVEKRLRADLCWSRGQEAANQAAQRPPEKSRTSSTSRRTKTAKAKRSVGTVGLLSPRCRSTGSCSTRSRRTPSKRRCARRAKSTTGSSARRNSPYPRSALRYEVLAAALRKVRAKLSAGRCMSVAVRMIVERERERWRFVSASWWDLIGVFAKQDDDRQRLETTLVSFDGKKLPSGKDFDQNNRPPEERVAPAARRRSREGARRADRQGRVRVASVERSRTRPSRTRPFTTSTLQQEANGKLGFTARRTMQVAQSLYEISRGERAHLDYLKNFYFGNGKPGLKKQLENKIDEIDAARFKPDLPSARRTTGRSLRAGPAVTRLLLRRGRKPASLPDELPPDEVKLDYAPRPARPSRQSGGASPPAPTPASRST
jgi:DNA topoisomerase-1